MTKTTPFVEFIRYSFFSIMGMIAISCYILADTFFVAQGIGTNGLAALNLAIPVYDSFMEPDSCSEWEALQNLRF